VIGSVTFVTGLAGAAVAFVFAERKLTALGWTPPVWHDWALTSQVGVRVVLGTGALLAVTALLALAAGGILRRSAGAITAVIGLAAAIVKCPGSCTADTTKLSLTGVMLGQATVATLAVLMMSSEYSTGMIRVTLAAMPRRPAVLAAKSAVVTGVILVAGAIAV